MPVPAHTADQPHLTSRLTLITTLSNEPATRASYFRGRKPDPERRTLSAIRCPLFSVRYPGYHVLYDVFVPCFRVFVGPVLVLGRYCTASMSLTRELEPTIYFQSSFGEFLPASKSPLNQPISVSFSASLQ
jgi:hypothetical protein